MRPGNAEAMCISEDRGPRVWHTWRVRGQLWSGGNEASRLSHFYFAQPNKDSEHTLPQMAPWHTEHKS